MSNLLNEESGFKFVTRKWNIVNAQWNANYGVGNEIFIRQKSKNLIFVITTMLTL